MVIEWLLTMRASRPAVACWVTWGAQARITCTSAARAGSAASTWRTACHTAPSASPSPGVPAEVASWKGSGLTLTPGTKDLLQQAAAHLYRHIRRIIPCRGQHRCAVGADRRRHVRHHLRCQRCHIPVHAHSPDHLCRRLNAKKYPRNIPAQAEFQDM